MRRYLIVIVTTTLFALLTGVGFALVQDEKPKYDEVELIEYEMCLAGLSDVFIIVADRPATRAKGFQWTEVLRFCASYKPKSLLVK